MLSDENFRDDDVKDAMIIAAVPERMNALRHCRLWLRRGLSARRLGHRRRNAKILEAWPRQDLRRSDRHMTEIAKTDVNRKARLISETEAPSTGSSGSCDRRIGVFAGRQQRWGFQFRISHGMREPAHRLGKTEALGAIIIPSNAGAGSARRSRPPRPLPPCRGCVRDWMTAANIAASIRIGHEITHEAACRS